MRSYMSEGTVSRSSDKESPSRGAPGKRTMVQGLQAPLQLRRSPDETAATASREDHVLQSASAGVSGTGTAIPHREQMESAFGLSFEHVQAHMDENAQDACQSIGANAFAMGDHVAFKMANPDPGLVAHELTHVVQQSGSLRPQAAVGTPGDAHEQEADAIAERVVQGESVAPLLEQHQEAGTPEPTVQGDTGLVQLSPGETNQELEDLLDAIVSQYSYICLKQCAAVEDLGKDAEKEDPPPLWQSLLVGAAELALVGALGGVGGVVVSKVGKALAGKVTDMVAEFVANGVADMVKDLGGTLVKGGIGLMASSTDDTRELFFRGQRDALTDTAAQLEGVFNTNGRDKIRKADKPMVQANALYKAIQSSLTTAYELQRNATLDAWCTYQAKKDLGEFERDGKKHGTDLSDQLGDTSAVGVLGIQMRCEKQGSTPTIERAEIEGLNEGMRKVLESRPLGLINVPMTVKGYVGEDVYFYETQPWIQIGRNEQGGVWVDPSYNLMWLYYRAYPNPEIWGPGGRTQARVLAGANLGARKLIENDMANLTLAGKLSG